MTLTVEDGTGLAAADSYISLTDATTYATAMGLDWSGDDASKESALRRAAKWLDGRYGAYFPGTRTQGRSQALQWPRRDAYDRDGNLIEGVPQEIKDAVMQAASREATSPGGLSPDVTTGKELTTLGELGWTLTGSGADSKRPTLTVVDDILGGLFDVGSATGGTRSDTFLRA